MDSHLLTGPLLAAKGKWADACESIQLWSSHLANSQMGPTFKKSLVVWGTLSWKLASTWADSDLSLMGVCSDVSGTGTNRWGIFNYASEVWLAAFCMPFPLHWPINVFNVLPVGLKLVRRLYFKFLPRWDLESHLHTFPFLFPAHLGAS